MRVAIGLMIAFACFNACVGQLLNTLVGTVSSLLGKRSDNFFSALDVNGDAIVEMNEFVAVAECFSRKLNIDEEGKRRLFETDLPNAWVSFGFNQVESGLAFHPKTLLNMFSMGKSIPSFRPGVRVAFELLFELMRCYSSNNTIRIEAFRVFHQCTRVDPGKTRDAYEKIDVNKDGGISKDELCGAGDDFVFGENDYGPGSLLLG